VASDGILDLTDPDALAAIGLDPAQRFAPWKSILLVDGGMPPGWAVATSVLRVGGAGILVPSAQFRAGTNLVLWRWNDGDARRIAALDPQTDLPRDQASWPDGATPAPAPDRPPVPRS
jgi:RES domain-containing protein